MFDNLATTIVQAVGFFGVFGFFAYQLLSDGKKSIKTDFKSSSKKVKQIKGDNNRPIKKGLFGRKLEPIKEEVKPKKKGWFK